MRKLVVVLLLAGCVVVTEVAAAEYEWVTITGFPGAIYEVAKGSAERTLTDRTTEPVIAFMVRMTRRQNNTVLFVKNFVRFADCDAGYGKLVTTKLDGSFMYDSDFVLGGGTIASDIAGVLCVLAGPAEATGVPRF